MRDTQPPQPVAAARRSVPPPPSETALVIHGHFYQPPRENPWTGVVDREPSAHPYHDWNARVHRECYRANAFARIVDGYGRVERIVNSFARVSFNVGPTLMSWIVRHDPAVYARILAADRESLRRLGHGNAIAQAYSHPILPLCNARDLVTQVRWGAVDFAHRFGRVAEGMWLPETACNDATLGALIDERIAFVILSPHQAERVRPSGEEGWRPVADGSVDPGRAYRYLHRDGSGRSLTVFFYDGPLANAIAFEGALGSSQGLVARLEAARGAPGRLLSAASDGETYGHHVRFGDRVLAYALESEAPARGFELTNFGAYLAAHPAEWDVEIKAGPDGEGTSWSCTHGVGRWCRDCGCSSGAREGWNQAWRKPLRDALDLVRDAAAECFESAGGELLSSPWDARDAYIELVVDRSRPRDVWLATRTRAPLGERDLVRALTCLEMQRHALLMYASCGWFFADISGLEAQQVLRYAGRVLDEMDELGWDAPHERFLEVLGEARSNLPAQGNGADVYRRAVAPLRVTPRQIAAHVLLSELLDDGADRGEAAGYRLVRSSFQRLRHERLALATGRVELESLTTRRCHDFGGVAIHLGGVDFYCVVRDFPGAQAFQDAAERLAAILRTASVPVLLRRALEELGPDEFGLESVLPEGRERITELVLGAVVETFLDEYAHLFETHQRMLEMLHQAGFPVPRAIEVAAELTLGRRFADEVQKAGRSREPARYNDAIQIAEQAARCGHSIETGGASREFGAMIEQAVGDAIRDGGPERLREAAELVELALQLHLRPDLDRAQERLHQALEEGAVPLGDARSLALALGFSSAAAVLTERPRPSARPDLEGAPPQR